MFVVERYISNSVLIRSNFPPGIRRQSISEVLIDLPEHYNKCWKSHLYTNILQNKIINVIILRGRHGRDYMVVGFITTYAIGAYHR